MSENRLAIFTLVRFACWFVRFGFRHELSGIPEQLTHIVRLRSDSACSFRLQWQQGSGLENVPGHGDVSSARIGFDVDTIFDLAGSGGFAEDSPNVQPIPGWRCFNVVAGVSAEDCTGCGCWYPVD